MPSNVNRSLFEQDDTGSITREHYDAFTMGFSNRSWEATVEILTAHQIQRVVDIRTLPGSKHTPQFNQENLQIKLPEIGIEYIHMKGLGGLRKPRKDSIVNAGWRNEGFRGYADYMQTTEFKSELDRLIALIREKRTVYMCTEAVFWRCHRQLVSDALVVRGFQIGHIFDEAKVEPHKLSNLPKVNGIEITYP
jgi:uncharacterized protein (DUF488 family)